MQLVMFTIKNKKATATCCNGLRQSVESKSAFLAWVVLGARLELAFPA